MSVAVLALAPLTQAYDKGVEVPVQQPILGTDTVAGCYSSLGDMTMDSTDKYNAQGYCAPNCRDKGFPVGATYAKACFCGTKMPNHLTLVNDTKCNEPCPGFDKQAFYNTGVQVNVAEADLPTSSTTSATPTPTSQTSATNTPTTPVQSQVPDDQQNKGSSTSTVGIAVGVVVGFLVVSAIAAGAYFYFRRKRNSEMEEEQRRNAAVNAFISGGKPPRSSGGVSLADSRMDPIMNRRMSDGSIADNQDYSRRILRVTNA
ncbi:hypothetical protein FHL15_003090 [Xylaria flabelliformis]|uniref:WSC domain-containing protein n=1 Tax=Xylaria flabelliformis TaxID=2512241 RepID=A0A553I6W8_9PEZI|nr:hypothetical protein FHL15_003090 [Xylaria flabelliformis]